MHCTKNFKDFFGKCDQIRSFLRNWSHLLKKSLMENFIKIAFTTNPFCLKFMNVIITLVIRSKLIFLVCYLSFLRIVFDDVFNNYAIQLIITFLLLLIC